MSRIRRAAAGACLAMILFAALPTSATAQRSAEIRSGSAASDSAFDLWVDAALEWGRLTLHWLQAIVAPEHGGIVPASPVPPTP